MKYLLPLILAIIISSGCGSIKEATGDYVTEAVKEKIEKDVDAALAKRNLSVKEITHSADTNNDGRVTKEEALAAAKDMLKDSILLEANKYVEKKLAESTASKGDLDSKANQFWVMILGLISAYLTKQIYSAKQDGKRNERLAVVEKILGFNGGPDPLPPTPAGNEANLQKKI